LRIQKINSRAARKNTDHFASSRHKIENEPVSLDESLADRALDKADLFRKATSTFLQVQASKQLCTLGTLVGKTGRSKIELTNVATFRINYPQKSRLLGLIG
jgi:hypothetical protein